MAKIENLKPRKAQKTAIPGAEFRRRMRDLNVSRNWLAEKIGKSPSTITRWTSDEAPIPVYAVFILELLERLDTASKNFRIK